MRGMPAAVALLLSGVIAVSACAGSTPTPSAESQITGESQTPNAVALGTARPDSAGPPDSTGEAAPEATAQPDPEETPRQTPATQPSQPPASPPDSPVAGNHEAPVTNAVIASAKYSYSMYRPRTHAVQKTDWYCVPASIQMMLNLVKGTSSHGKAAQTMYWRYAQDHSTYPITDNGADAGGWAAAMKHWGAGNFTVGIHKTMQASLRAAAKRMRATGKPVGMLVWGRHGGHAWVMTGFRATADPKNNSEYTVTSVQAMGPLWPLGTIDGKPFDPGPREWISYSTLKQKFTENVQRNAPDWNGRWITVLP